eukprot:PITA_28366
MIISTKSLPKWNSDHKPILLLLEEEENLGLIPFWFSPLWTNREGFMDTLNKAWSIHVLRSPSYVWEQNIKATKVALKQWIKNPIDSPTTQQKQSIKQLLDLQMGLEIQDITRAKIHSKQEHQISTLQTFREEEEYLRLKSCNLWLAMGAREEEEYLRLKSCNLWLALGDKNTAFFHKQILTRLYRNHIAEITSPYGTVLKGTTLIKEGATSHFQQMFKEEGMEDDEEAHDFLKNILRMVNEEENATLLKPFTEEEISNVIWTMEPDKA